MSKIAIIHIGSAPAEEACAQLGRTNNFTRWNSLEVNTYRAAIIACWGKPPTGVSLRGEVCRHDFGSYIELQARFDPTDEASRRYVETIETGLARWLDAGFLAPVRYNDRSQVCDQIYSSHFEAARRVIVALERRRTEGLCTPAEAARLANLRDAYPTDAIEADQLLRQLGTEHHVRAPENRRVGIYAPYALTFFPALFNDHRGPDYPAGDAIDVTAFELRRRGRAYIMCNLGSVKTLDQALDLCWEHMARYVIP